MLISLFCGPGGLDEGFKRAGFATIYATDIDKAAVETHNENHWDGKHDPVAIQGDITELQVSDLIIRVSDRMQARGFNGQHPVGIIGGPPCQSFSYANTNQTEEDKRHSLPSHYARIIKGLRDHGWLDFFLFENVPGLKGLHREKFEQFKREFEEAGFTLYEDQLEAWQFGVPQLRPRVFIVGIRNDHPAAKTFSFPTPLIRDRSQARTVEQAIKNIPSPVFFRKDVTPWEIVMDAGHANHWCMNPQSPKFEDGTFSKPGKFGKSFAVLDWKQPSLTVAYGHREVHIHPSGKRRLSVYEAMKLQGFPDEYVLKGTLSDQIRLVSEVVAPPVAYHIAKAIGRHLGLDLQANPAPTWLDSADA